MQRLLASSRASSLFPASLIARSALPQHAQHRQGDRHRGEERGGGRKSCEVTKDMFVPERQSSSSSSSSRHSRSRNHHGHDDGGHHGHGDGGSRAPSSSSSSSSSSDGYRVLDYAPHLSPESSRHVRGSFRSLDQFVRHTATATATAAGGGGEEDAAVAPHTSLVSSRQEEEEECLQLSDLLARMLEIDPAKRVTAHEALSFIFVK